MTSWENKSAIITGGGSGIGKALGAVLETDVSRELGASWRPDIRSYLTQVGGPPYPVDKFVDYALDQIQKNKGIIVAPFGARLRLALNRFFPGVVEGLTRKAYLEMLVTRPKDQ